MSGKDDETAQRDDVLRRMLKTPPTPHKPTDKRSNATEAETATPNDPKKITENQ